MTPEEAAVINAAIELYHAPLGQNGKEAWKLRDATEQLIFRCNDCNYARHQCPGCGTPVPHAGSSVCAACLGEASGSAFAEMMRKELRGTVAPLPEPETVDCPLCSAQSQDLPAHMADYHPSVWVTRTWRDVRTGDHVRMPGTDVTAHIGRRYLHPSQDPQGRTWHVISGGDGQRARFNDHTVLPSECVVLLAGEKEVRFMDPAKPVEIEMTVENQRAAELLGWENRV
jgi:hypothetical protein